MNKVQMKIRCDNLFVVDPVGKSGGLAAIWRKDMNITKLLVTDFAMELLVEEHNRNKNW